MNTKILGLVVAVVVVIGGILWFVQSQNQPSPDAMMEKEGTMMKKENVGDSDTMVEPEKMDTKTMVTGGYKEYDPTDLAFAETGKVVLFFHADWCPYCRALNEELTKNPSQIPSDTLIAKVNYDTADDLKKKYGVISQHTFVQVDKDGNKLSMWQGSNSLDEFLQEVK